MGTKPVDEINPNADVDPGSTPPIQTKILPWLEVNYLEPWRIDECVAGIKFWEEVTDTVIISTIAGKTELYRDLLARDDINIKIIPGLKTSSIMGNRFDESSKWVEVGEEVKKICDAAQTDKIIFEHETALKNHRDNYGLGGSINHWRLYKALKKLPQDINYIWYPAFIGNQPEWLEWYYRVSITANMALTNVDYTDRTWDDPLNFPLRFLPRSVVYERLKWINKIISGELLPMAYFYGPGSQWWMDEQISVLLDEHPDNLIVYPGSRRWVEASEKISGYIKEYNG